MADWKHERGRVASLSRSRTPDDPELILARQNLKLARLELYIARTISAEPALTGPQRGKLAALLISGGAK